MRLHCEACGAAVPATAIDPQAGLATCAACGHVFRCQNQLDDSLLPGTQRRREVSLPAGVRLFRRHNDLRITRRWLSTRAVSLLVFACFWDGCLVLLFGFAPRRALGPLAALGALHLAAGIGVTYAAIAGLVNTTVITAAQGLLEIRHGPLPWLGNRRVEARQLNQLYAKRVVNRSKHGTHTSYQLRAHTQDGKDIKLVGVEREDQALFIQQRLEDFCAQLLKGEAGTRPMVDGNTC